MEPSDITRRMFEADPFSQWLGIVCLYTGPGSCILQMTVRKEMCNGFGIAHGGITFSLADSAFAFASNSRGQHAVSIETSISHHLAVQVGDQLTASATEVTYNNKLGWYTVDITNQHQEQVASFHGTVYRKRTAWE